MNLFSPEFRDHVWKGSAVGAGVSWGYHHPLNSQWALELGLGMGYLRLNHDKYRCAACDEHLGREGKHYLGPTKATVSLIWMIK
jgi:hypothetical protein